MIALVSGSSGLIGREFLRSCAARGVEVRRLVRGRAKIGDVGWDPDAGTIHAAAMEGVDVVVHLAGEPLANGRWSAAKKQRIMHSRESGTRLLAQSLAKMTRPPRVMLSASAIGFYGSRGDEVLDESSKPGTGFLAEVCGRWEAATRAAEDAGIRVVHLRIGVVLSRDGGALKQMLPVFRLGLGGRLGNGRQYLSWIAMEDVIGAIWHAIERQDIRGPVNLVSPRPVTNIEFTRTLAAALHRPALLLVPAPLLRLAVGEMADEAVLASARVMPRRLVEGGYVFVAPTLDGAFGRALR